MVQDDEDGTQDMTVGQTLIRAVCCRWRWIATEVGWRQSLGRLHLEKSQTFIETLAHADITDGFGK